MKLEQTWLLPIALLSPLVGVFINGLIFKTKSSLSQASKVTLSTTLLSFFIFFFLFLKLDHHHNFVFNFGSWLNFGSFVINFKLFFDPLASILCFMVTGIGSLIALFGRGYMEHDRRPGKFFTYFSLFVFMMLILVLADNMVFFFFGWEGVGLCSYLLIGFWYTDEAKASAGKKAFLVNRIGDFGLIIGIIGYSYLLGKIDFASLATIDPEFIVQHKLPFTIYSGFIILGVSAKSAQIPLFVWLPDAMAGPTPVSALIHAATMVTAGIYLLCRLSWVLGYLDFIMQLLVAIGCLTALFAALIALTQRDIKKVLAYSTMSQLGYMVLGCGIGAFSTAFFHVFTHAFFKALLFLCAGAVIHFSHHQQDIFKIKGIREKYPVIFWSFFIGYLAIIGIPPFSGFFSKDEIMWLTLNSQHGGVLPYAISLFTAFLTSFYMSRLVFISFMKQKEAAVVPEGIGSSFKLPLIILALFSMVIGFWGMPHFLAGDAAHRFQHFLSHSSVRDTVKVHYSHEIEYALLLLGLMGIITMSFWAYRKYVVIPQGNYAARQYRNIWQNLSYHKFYVDEFYQKFVIRPLHVIVYGVDKILEKNIFDGLLNGIAELTTHFSEFFKKVTQKKYETIILSTLIFTCLVLLTFWIAL